MNKSEVMYFKYLIYIFLIVIFLMIGDKFYDYYGWIINNVDLVSVKW